MTIEQFSIKHLTDNGLWPQEAIAVVYTAKKAMEAEMDGQRRWNDDIEGYPKPFWGVMMLTLNRRAVEYIDANKPMHFARPMFTGELNAS